MSVATEAAIGVDEILAKGLNTHADSTATVSQVVHDLFGAQVDTRTFDPREHTDPKDPRTNATLRTTYTRASGRKAERSSDPYPDDILPPDGTAITVSYTPDYGHENKPTKLSQATADNGGVVLDFRVRAEGTLTERQEASLKRSGIIVTTGAVEGKPFSSAGVRIRPGEKVNVTKLKKAASIINQVQAGNVAPTPQTLAA